MELTPMPAEGAAITVLAVDDEPIILLGTAALLQSLGHRVVKANNARLALEVLDADPTIKAVVTDYHMPGMSGLDLIKEVVGLNRKIAAVLITGRADLAPGVTDRWTRILKPFSRNELSDALNAALAAAR